MEKVKYVVLVHGIFNQGSLFNHFSDRLAKNGFLPLAIDLKPNYGAADLSQLALQLKEFIDDHVPQGESLALVGFSMGGLVCRHYLQYLGGVQKTKQFIAIASPHQGTLTGFLLPLKGCLQMRVGSSYLKALNSSIDQLKPLAPISIWTPFDQMFIPPSSCKMTIGTAIQVPIFPHKRMATAERVAKVLIHCLSEPRDVT